MEETVLVPHFGGAHAWAQRHFHRAGCTYLGRAVKIREFTKEFCLSMGARPCCYCHPEVV